MEVTYSTLRCQIFSTINGGADNNEILAATLRTRGFKRDTGQVIDVFICRKLETVIYDRAS